MSQLKTLLQISKEFATLITDPTAPESRVVEAEDEASDFYENLSAKELSEVLLYAVATLHKIAGISTEKKYSANAIAMLIIEATDKNFKAQDMNMLKAATWALRCPELSGVPNRQNFNTKIICNNN